MSPRVRRLMLFGGIAAAIVSLVVWAYRPRPVLVDVGEVTRGAMSTEISEEGKTRIREVYVVSAPIAGRLERVQVEVGDRVTSTETSVARLRPVEPALLDRRTIAELENAVTAAAAARDAAAADVRRAKSDYDRLQAVFRREAGLFERGVVAKARYDNALSARDSARASWDSARDTLRAREADLARAQAALITPNDSGRGETDDTCCVTLSAPVDGEVLALMRESESVVAAGAPILEIGDPSDIEIVAEMLSADAVQIHQGAAVRIDGWGGRELEGRVHRVEPSGFTKVSALGIEEQRVNVLIDLESDPALWTRLAHRFRVDVHVETWSADDVVRAPVSALFRLDGGWSVYAIDQGRAHRRAVKVGRMNQEAAEVMEGLEVGEKVVLHPTERVADRTRVASRRD